jgi:hypothetical protein
MRMSGIPGVDYSSGRPGGKALAAAGMRFAARYLSHTEKKNLTRSEATDLAEHGVSVVVVWETTAQRASAGRAAGAADAREAAAQAAACGQPRTRPIYFAVDYDAAPSAVVAYFQGVASVIGLPRTGVYGGYRVVDYLLDHRLASWAWQTVAWSGGRWDQRAHIRQYASTVRINGVTCDHDTAMQTDFGQWSPGITPTRDVQEDSTMAISSDDARIIGRQVVTGANGMHGPGTTKEWSVSAYLSAIYAQGAAQAAAITALAQQLGTGRDVDTIVTAVQQAIADAVVQVHVDITGTPETPTP